MRDLELFEKLLVRLCLLCISLISHTNGQESTTSLLPSATPLPSIASPLPSATPLPNGTAMPTTEDPIQRHLALIIGVPTGVGLAVFGILLCILWLMCSTYQESKARAESQGGSQSNSRTKPKKNISGGPVTTKTGVTAGSSSVGTEDRYEPEPTQFEPDSTQSGAVSNALELETIAESANDANSDDGITAV